MSNKSRLEEQSKTQKSMQYFDIENLLKLFGNIYKHRMEIFIYTYFPKRFSIPLLMMRCSQ